MKQTKTKQSVRQILTLMLAFVMVFTGMGIGSWGVDTAWADTITITANAAGIEYPGHSISSVNCSFKITGGSKNDIIVGDSYIATDETAKSRETYIVTLESANDVTINSSTGKADRQYTCYATASGSGKLLLISKKGKSLSKLTATTLPEIKETDFPVELLSTEAESFYFIYFNYGTAGDVEGGKDFALLIQIVPPKNVDKNILNAAIVAAPDDKDAMYYHTKDYWNGKEYNENGFWTDMRTIVESAQAVADSTGATQEEVDAAAATLDQNDPDSALFKAIANLIPKARVNPTALYEEVNKCYRWVREDSVKDEVSAEYNDTNKVTANTTTAASWAPYASALNQGKELLKYLYDKDGNATKENTNALQEDADAIVKKITSAADRLVWKETYDRDYTKEYLPYIDEARTFLKQFSPEALGNNADGDYTKDSWGAYLAAYETFKAKCEHEIKTSLNNPNGGTWEDFETVFYFNGSSFSAFKSAVNNLASGKEVTASLEYINNTVPLFAKTKTAKTGTDIYVKKDELELKTGATTLKDLLEKAEIRFSTGSISLSPVSGQTFTVVNETPWLMVLVNGEFRGMRSLKAAEKMQIHEGDAVKIVRCAYGIGTYTYSGGSGETLGDYTNYARVSNLRVLGSSLGEIQIDAISENAKVGEKVNLKASVTGLYQDKQGKAMSSEGLALYISEPYDNEQQSTDSLKLTTARTDQNGETSYIFREAGDYIIALFDTNEDTLYQEAYNEMVVAGDYHGLRAGAYARVHVEDAEAPASLVESSRKENLAQAEAFFRQYQKDDFNTTAVNEQDVTYEMFKAAYDELVAHQNATKDFKELMNTFDADFANLKEKASKVRNHEAIVGNVKATLAKLPQTKEELSWRQKNLLKELKTAYDRLNPTEKKLLTKAECEQIESYLAIPPDSLTEPEAKQILIVKDDGFKLGGTNNNSGDYGNYNHVYSSDGYQETKIYPVAHYNFDVAYYSPGTKYANSNEYNENCGNNDRFEPKHKYLRAKSGDRIEIRRMFELLSEDQGGARYSIDGGKTWKLMRRTLAGEYNGVKTYFVYANFYMPDIEEDSLTVQIAPLTQAEYDAWYAEENQETLDKARADAKTVLGAAFAKYEASAYSSANWAAIEKAKTDGEAAIDQAASLDEINDAKNQAIAEMAKILTKEQQENASKPSTGDSDRPLPNYGSVVGKVHIIVENTTFTKAGSNGAPAWYGTLIDGYYDLCKNDTMMTAVLKALQLKGCNWSTGAQGVASSWDDYGISYLASIKVPETVKADGSNFVLNDASQRLGEFSGESGSGWMGTLNDWFTNFGFQEFGYQNGELKDGDEIHIMFTQNLGVDINGTWNNSDTTLKDLTISNGTLSPAFDSKTGAYTLLISGSSANLKVTPTAANKNYQTRIYLNEYLKDSAEYRRTSLIPVKAGDTLYIGCGERAWPSMNKQGAEARAYTGTKYTIKVINSADASAVVKMIDELPAADKLTIYSYKSYTAAAANARNAYKNLKAEAQKNVTNYDKLTKVEEKIKFYTEIDDAKAKLHALTATSSSAQSREALAAYNKLSDAQKKYITTLDVEKFNELAKKYNLSSIAGAAEMPESNVTTSGKQTTAILEPTVSDGTANATVDTDTLTEIKKQATEAKSNELTLSVSKDAKGEAVDKVNVKVDVKTLNNLASKQDLALTVSTEIGTLRFDSAALREILTQAGGSELTITIAKKTLGAAEQKLLGDKAAGYTVTVSSGGKSISHFGGNVTVTLEIPDSLTDKKVAAVYIDSADKFTHMPGNKKTISGKAYYVFTTTHFSDFALVDAEALGIEVADEDTLAQVKSLVSDLALTARSAKTAKKNVKVTLKNSAKTKAAIKEIKDLGYTVKYRFYRSTKKSAGYKSAVTKKTANYTNTSGKKNTKYFYKVQVRVYDENGKLVAKTALKQCKYGSRVEYKG